MLHRITIYYKDNVHKTYNLAYIYFNFECDTMLLDYKDENNDKWELENVYLEEVKEIEIDGEFYDTFELSIDL